MLLVYECTAASIVNLLSVYYYNVYLLEKLCSIARIYNRLFFLSVFSRTKSNYFRKLPLSFRRILCHVWIDAKAAYYTSSVAAKKKPFKFIERLARLCSSECCLCCAVCDCVCVCAPVSTWMLSGQQNVYNKIIKIVRWTTNDWFINIYCVCVVCSILLQMCSIIFEWLWICGNKEIERDRIIWCCY